MHAKEHFQPYDHFFQIINPRRESTLDGALPNLP